MICPNGHPNRDGANYCRICGVPLTAPAGQNASRSRSKLLPGVLIAIIVVLAGLLFMKNGGDSGKDTPVSRPAETAPAIRATEPKVTEPKPTEPKVTVPPTTKPDGYLAEVDGRWESVYLEDGTQRLNVYAYVLDQKLVECKKLTLLVEVEMNAGTKCYDWNVWIRRNGVFEKYTQVRLPDGDGRLETTLSFNSPVTFDAIIVTPTVAGGYSWSLGIGIFDVYLDN